MVKQVIVVRKDLNMRKGKMCVQVAHASLKVLLDRMRYHRGVIISDGNPSLAQLIEAEETGIPIDPKDIKPRETTNEYILYARDEMKEWLEGDYTKIVVSVDSEKELHNLAELCIEENIPCAFAIDNGTTEFHGVKTHTALAIGPDTSEKIDKITGNLPLL